MHIVCNCDGARFDVSESALSRSELLADLHSCDPDGGVYLPCDSHTWQAWLSDNIVGHRDDLNLLLKVLRVCEHSIYVPLLRIKSSTSQCIAQSPVQTVPYFVKFVNIRIFRGMMRNAEVFCIVEGQGHENQ
jgi:hypothetical protein